MKISDRIALFAKYNNMSIRSLEQSIGASNGLLSKAISKSTDISSQWVTKILEAYPDLSASWLLTGEGNMLMATDQNIHTVNDIFTDELGDHSSIISRLLCIVEKQAETIESLSDSIREIKWMLDKKINGE